ncbi:MFS general substrate transporter [Xylariaceae sp. FL0255]|nr:MFS general substrate transporter [Xylariaceae sp. FL0255]
MSAPQDDGMLVGSTTEKGESNMSIPPETEVKTSTRSRKKPLQFYLAFLSLVIMVLIASIDATALSVAIPVIIRQLNGTSLDGFWANLTYLLAVVITQPLYVSASDIIGRKPMLNTAYFFYFIGSIIFATGPSIGAVIAGRLVQGFGGGGLDVLNEVLICDITSLKERPLWIGLMAIPLAVGTILGPILGAAFTQYASWRYVSRRNYHIRLVPEAERTQLRMHLRLDFKADTLSSCHQIGWINLPLVALSFGLAAYALRLKPVEGPLKVRLRRLDWVGMLLFTIGSAAFALPLSWGGALYPWSSFRTILPLIIGFLVLVVFGVYEARPAEPVVPYRIISSRTAVATVIGATLQGIVLYPLLLYLPLFFQAVYLETPLQAAVSILPLCAGVIAAAFLSGLAVEHLRHYRWQLWVGWIATALGIGLFGLWGSNFSRAETAIFQLLAAVGLGVYFAVPAIAMQASAKVEDQGLAVGTMVTFRLFGGLIGLAIGSTIFSNSFSSSISALDLQSLPQYVADLGNSANAVAFITELRDIDIPDELRSAIRMAYNGAMRVLWYFLAGVSVVGLITSVFVQNLSIETEDVGKQHIQETPRAEHTL